MDRQQCGPGTMLTGAKCCIILRKLSNVPFVETNPTLACNKFCPRLHQIQPYVGTNPTLGFNKLHSIPMNPKLNPNFGNKKWHSLYSALQNSLNTLYTKNVPAI